MRRAAGGERIPPWAALPLLCTVRGRSALPSSGGRPRIAYKVAGGRDTEVAIARFGLTDSFDWISVGGGAMLEFLAKGTLPGIEVLI